MAHLPLSFPFFPFLSPSIYRFMSRVLEKVTHLIIIRNVKYLHYFQVIELACVVSWKMLPHSLDYEDMVPTQVMELFGTFRRYGLGGGSMSLLKDLQVTSLLSASWLWFEMLALSFYSSHHAYSLLPPLLIMDYNLWSQMSQINTFLCKMPLPWPLVRARERWLTWPVK